MYYHGIVTRGQTKAQRQQCHPVTPLLHSHSQVEVLQLSSKPLHSGHFLYLQMNSLQRNINVLISLPLRVSHQLPTSSPVHWMLSEVQRGS